MQLREERDADRNEFAYTASQFPEGENQYPVICVTCTETYYVDHHTQEQVTNSIAAGRDNPFECDECVNAREEPAYSDQ